MSVLGALRAPLNSLACHDCVEDLHVTNEAYRPLIVFADDGEAKPDLDVPSVQLDIKRLSWRLSESSYYTVEAVAVANCPSCLKKEELRALVASSKAVLTSGLNCSAHDSEMLIEQFEMAIADGDGSAQVTLTAKARCQECATPVVISCPTLIDNVDAAGESPVVVRFGRDQATISSLQPDVVLLVSADDELRAVLRIFCGDVRGGLRCYATNFVALELGEFGGAQVVCVRSEAGSGGVGGSSLTTWDLIQTLAPRAVVALGTVFGMQDGRQRISDVVVATHVVAYEPARLGLTANGSEVSVSRGERVPVSIGLLARLRVAAADWEHPVHFGAVISGEKVVDSINARARLLSVAPEAIAGEMEGWGMATAAMRARTTWAVVKAISDFGDGRKAAFDVSRENAAAESARFLLHALHLGGWDAGPEHHAETIE